VLDQQEISDRLEIQNLLVSYCDAIDGRNWDVLDNIFTPDAVIDYTEARTRQSGRDKNISRKSVETFFWHAAHVGSPINQYQR